MKINLTYLRVLQKYRLPINRIRGAQFYATCRHYKYGESNLSGRRLHRNLIRPLLRVKANQYSTSPRCWRCGAEVHPVHDIFCTLCDALQKTRNTEDYFEVIGINKAFEIDLKELTQKYHTLQVLFHPDKYNSKSNEEKVISEERSALVNRAYNTLRSPLQRGLHLLGLNGESIEKDAKSDPAFLAEIMTKYEEVDDASELNDCRTLYESSNQIIERLSLDISTAFKNNNISEAKLCLSKMKYYDSINKQLKTKIQKMELM